MDQVVRRERPENEVKNGKEIYHQLVLCLVEEKRTMQKELQKRFEL